MGKASGGSAKQDVNEYRLSIHFGISWLLDGIKRILIDDKVAWEGDASEQGAIYINRPDLFGGPKKEGGVGGIAYYLPGGPTQVLPDALARKLDPSLSGATCPAFRGVSTIWFTGSSGSNGVSWGGDMSGGFYWTANSPFIRPVAITGWRAPKGLDPDYAMIGPDANGVHMIYECLTETDWGMGAPSWQFDLPVWEAKAVQLFDEEFGLSMMWAEQSRIEDFVTEIIDHIQATLFVNPRTGLLSIELLRDDYEIELLREVNPGNANFSNFQRKLWGETANELVGTWTNPENEKEETLSIQDLGNIAIQGGVVSDNRHYYGIRNAELLQRVLARDIRSASAPLAMLETELDRSFWDTLPGEVLKVTWPEKNLDRLVMRVMRVRYGRKGDPAVKVTLLEDIFSLVKPPALPAPGGGGSGTAEEPSEMAHSQVFTLPLFLASRALGANIADLAYPEVAAGVLANQPGNDTFAYNLYYEFPMANGDMAWVDGGAKSVIGRATMLTPLYQEAVSPIAGLPSLGTGRNPVVGGLVFIGDGSDAGSEIGLLRAFEDGTWTVDRGVLDTVPRSWPVDTPVWFVNPTSVIADDDDIRAAGETAEYKLLSRTSLGLLPLDDASVVSGTMTARPHLPLRPAKVAINGVGFGDVDATGASELVISWATRNRLFEDGQALRWSDDAVAPEYLQETLISVYRENGDAMFQVRGLWEHGSYTIPIAWVQEEEKIFVRVSAERGGLASLQSYGLWVGSIPQVGSPGAPPVSPVIVAGPPEPPDPDPDPTPEPLPPPGDTPWTRPPGLDDPGEWQDVLV